MNNNLNLRNPENEPIVIPDECGDSLWEAVLEQEAKPSGEKNISKIFPLPNGIDDVQECDASKAE